MCNSATHRQPLERVLRHGKLVPAEQAEQEMMEEYREELRRRSRGLYKEKRNDG